jgi:hypothetical protein
MGTLGFAETSLRQDELAEGTKDHSLEWGPPPLAPTGTSEARHPELVARKPAVYAHEDDLLHGPEQDDLLNAPEQNDLSASSRSFSVRRKLAGGTAIVAALGVCAYFLFASPTNKTAPQSAEVSAAIQPVPVSSVQTALNASGSSAQPDASQSASSRTEALPAEPVDASAKVQAVEASQKVEPAEAFQKPEPVRSQKMVAAASPTTAEARTSLAARTEDVLFLQRPGVNIRSTPSKSGTGIGTAPKGTRFKVLSREADWIQVQNGRLKGWINAQFLAPTQPQ